MNICYKQSGRGPGKGCKEMLKEAIDVLLIDDDTQTALEMEHFLTQQEDIHQVNCACSVREAVEYCSLCAYDIAVVDLVMPGSDGFSFLEHAAEKMEHAPDTIIVSAISSEDVIKKSFHMGAKYYMIKPYQKDTLYRRMWDVLRLREGEPSGTGMVAGGTVSLDQRIGDLFLRMGVPPHLKGYQYLKEAVKLTVQDRMIIYSITRELYPRIAKTFGVTSTKVELAIRHTVEVMYDRDRMRHLQEVLGFPSSVNKQKPTNGELIALIADKLISEGNE